MSAAAKIKKADGRTKKIVVVSCQQCPKIEGCSKFNQIKKKDRFVLLCGVGVPDVFHDDCPLEEN
jgi:hypothetical protein